MLLELLILFQVMGFVFLALGILPYKTLEHSGNLPFGNKIIFIFVSTIIFFSLAVVSVNYDYMYCYVEETILTTPDNMVNTATCASFSIEDISISYFNWGMGLLSIVVGIIIIIMGALSKDDYKYKDED